MLMQPASAMAVSLKVDRLQQRTTIHMFGGNELVMLQMCDGVASELHV